MKKLLIVIIALIGLVPSVKADTRETITIVRDQYEINLNKGCGIISCNESAEEIANELIQYYNQNIDTQTYNRWYIRISSNGNINDGWTTNMTLNYFKNSDMTYVYNENGIGINLNENLHHMLYINNNEINSQAVSGYNEILIGGSNNYYYYYDSNFEWTTAIYNYEINGYYSQNDSINLNIGDTVPKVKDMINYQSWAEYNQNKNAIYQEVNLDNYLYVILTLKNYNQNNEFQTNLQVKGMIGITPIYNYGQTSKDAVTGVKVQDRCNVSYTQYTTYPLYVLKQDLQNNVVYAVKSCENNSSFKYDSNIFNVTYVTNENKDDPIVTINGQQYHTIPFQDLPSTANKNEEENYIPGQSGNANDTGGLDGAVKGIQQKMSEIWNTFTYFTEFINQMFSVLPEELRIILVSAFTVMIVLGLIKIFIN